MKIGLVRIIEAQADTFIGRINTNMRSTGTDATGKTSSSLTYKISEVDGKPSVDLVGRAFFKTVETGRKPTPDKKPSREMIENISEWVKARGKPESMVWAIATNIQKKGTKLWQKGGRKDIYSNEIPPFVASLSKAITEYYATELLKLLK